MIDTVHFTCKRPLKAEVMNALRERGMFENDEWIVTYRTRKTYRAGDSPYKLELCYKPKRKVLTARGHYPYVEHVAAQLPAMLHPCNGYILRNQSELDTAMENVHRALDSVAERGIQWTDTVRLDLILNLPIDPGRVINSLTSVRFALVRKLAKIFEEPNVDEGCLVSSAGQTLEWQGKHTWLGFYNKTRKGCKELGAPYSHENAVLRGELKLMGKKHIARFLGDKSPRPSPIVHLNYFSLYRHFRDVLCYLTTGRSIRTKCDLMSLMAACEAGQFRPNGASVLDWYGQHVSSETMRKTRKLVTGMALKMQGFSFDKILPPLGPPEQVDVRMDGTIEPVWDPSWGQHTKIIQGNDGFQYVAVE